jgi:lipoate-protein ligase A
VKKGKIENITIYGDFFGKKELSDLETALKECPHNKEAITEALSPFNLDEYMHNITLDDFLELIID